MDGGLVHATEEGTPQGSPLSPLLSNVMLDDLDWELEKRGHRFVRYADDGRIYVKSERAGKRVMQSITHHDGGDVPIGLVGEDRLEAVAVVVGKGQLRAGVRALAADDQPRSLRPGGEVDVLGDSATSPFSRSLPSWSSAATHASSGSRRITARTGSVRS